MSDETLAVVLTLALIACMFAWVPLLKLVCPPCARALDRRKIVKLEMPAGASVPES